MTYNERSATSVIASFPWPIPLVSTITKSNPTALQASIERPIQSAISLPLCLLANERMNRFSSDNEFILILSPSKAPPVLLRVGSVASKAILVPGLSLCILNISSSVRLDFPAPPVPVKPTTGHVEPSFDLTFSNISLNISSFAFSANVNNLETEG